MIQKKRSSTVALCGVAACSVMLVVAGPTTAKTKTKSITITDVTTKDSTGLKYTGKLGGTLGKGTSKGAVALPKITETWKFKGGTITYKSPDAHLVGANAVGTWKITKGTGKFKGIKGSGTYTAPLAKLSFTFKGKIKY